MPYCVIKHCKSCSQKPRRKDGISFHKFPAEIALRKEWIFIVRKSRKENDWVASRFCVICSLHFKDDDFYYSNKGRRLIKKQSKPTQMLYELSSPQTGVATEGREGTPPGSAESVLSNNDDDDDVALSSIAVDELLGPHNEKSPIDSEINDSDLDSSILDIETPQLRRELRRHQLLRVATKRKLKTMGQKVRRLKKKNASLKNILKGLKDKKVINGDTHKQLSDIFCIL